MSGKNIALMYISEVSGHHSATLAIEKSIKTLDPNAQILNINAFKYTNPISEKVVNQIYTTVIKRTPKLWDMVYDNPKVKKRLDKIKNIIHKMNSPKFKHLFGKFRPDAVICTQAFPCGMVADYKKSYGINVPLIAVLTDFVPHSYWVYDTVDCYVTPSEEIAAKLVEKGVPGHKVRALGIPFDNKFNANVEKQKVYQKMGLQENVPIVLIMGGGQGLGPIKTIVKSLEQAKTCFQEVIITGTNRKLYKALKKRSKKSSKKVSVLGYVNNINELMSIASMIITKPGGITTSEALSKKLPMLILKPIPGQEENNTAFLTKKEAAIRIEDPKEVHLIVDELLANPHKLKHISEAAGKISKPNASIDIARLVLNLTHA